MPYERSPPGVKEELLGAQAVPLSDMVNALPSASVRLLLAWKSAIAFRLPQVPVGGHTRARPGGALGPSALQPLARRRVLSSRGANRRSVGGRPFVGVGLDRGVPRQIVAVGVDQIDVAPDHRPELVGGELSVGDPHAVGVGCVRGRGKGPLARLATSEPLEEVHGLCDELGRPNSLVPLTRARHLLASLAPWPGCAG